MITWELPTELEVFHEEKGEEPYVVSKTYTLSMHEKATLRRDLESWRGQGFTEKEAEAFILAVPLILEWEGRSENPKSEADFVESWLQKRPETSIAPFLYLLKAHRLRAAFEAARARNEKKLWPVLATKYKEAVVKAKSFDHPLMTCIVDDMEAQDYVYLEGYGKP
jgi:hypothetical protein